MLTVEAVGAHGKIRTREGGGISGDQCGPTKLETLVSRSLVEQEQQQTFNSDFEGNVAKADKNWSGLVKKYGK